MLSIDSLLLIASVLILLSVLLTRISENLGIPVLLIFLAIGMLAGSEGPGGIYFDDAGVAQGIGVVALVIILFAGGLDTSWSYVRPVLWGALSLATLGVVLTALAVGAFAIFFLRFPPLEGFLLGAIISSTDAAAVFAVLRSKSVRLRGNLAPLLELESGSNDPMAVFLTVSLLQLIQMPERSAGDLVWLFVQQMGIGVVAGLLFGRGLVYFLNRVALAAQGIYPVLLLAGAGLTYAATAMLGGSGFMAVYLAGIVAGNREFLHKRSLKRFFAGLAWLSQIVMFLTLGLLVFPSRLIPVASIGFLVSAFLMLVARPFGVFVSLAASRISLPEKLFVTWGGLRGAVPTILATFPLMAGLPGAELLFNLVFFIVLTSALLQGWSMPAAARLLKVDAPPGEKIRTEVDLENLETGETRLTDFMVPYNAEIAGLPVVEIGLPRQSLIVLVTRNERYIVPDGSTRLEEGDVVLVMSCAADLPAIREVFSRLKA